MDKLDLLVRRSKKLEGKDIGAILGFDKYIGIKDVYKEKTEIMGHSRIGPEATYWTNTLEEVVSREFMIRTKKNIRKNSINSVSKDYDFMASSVNRKIIGENSILDCKVINGIDEDYINDKKFIQASVLNAQHNMKVKKADKCYLAILINNERFIIKEVKRDDKLISRIVIVEERFWNDYIIKNIEPKEPLILDN